MLTVNNTQLRIFLLWYFLKEYPCWMWERNVKGTRIETIQITCKMKILIDQWQKLYFLNHLSSIKCMFWFVFGRSLPKGASLMCTENSKRRLDECMCNFWPILPTTVLFTSFWVRCQEIGSKIPLGLYHSPAVLQRPTSRQHVGNKSEILCLQNWYSRWFGVSTGKEVSPRMTYFVLKIFSRSGNVSRVISVGKWVKFKQKIGSCLKFYLTRHDFFYFDEEHSVTLVWMGKLVSKLLR